MTLKEIGNEYKKSKKPIKNRIVELKKEREGLQFLMQAKEKGKKRINLKIIKINERLKPLNAMYRDLSEIGREAENYYSKGWWRSEKYTLNSRKSRRPVFGFILDNEGENECEAEAMDDESSFSRNRRNIDGEAEGSCINVLLQRVNNS